MPVVECFIASRPQEGCSASEDAFLVAPQADPPWLAVCDGAGHAQQAARRVLRLFERLIAEADTEAVALFPTWARWPRTLDSALLGGTQSTFLAVSVLERRIVGVCVGDTRAYLWTRDGELRILTEGAAKHRLGSGRVEPFPIHAPLERGDVVLLLTDGAWTPLSLHGLQRLVAGCCVPVPMAGSRSTTLAALHRRFSSSPALGREGSREPMSLAVSGLCGRGRSPQPFPYPAPSLSP